MNPKIKKIIQDPPLSKAVILRTLKSLDSEEIILLLKMDFFARSSKEHPTRKLLEELMIEKQLFKKNAYINEKGRTPLMYACQYHYHLIELLVKAGSDINIQNNNSNTLLMWCCRNKPDLVHQLITLGADVNKPNDEGKTPIMIALKYHENLVPLLVKSHANIHAKSNNGWTPLMYAIDYQTSYIKALIKLGADPYEKNQYGTTALEMAKKEDTGIYKLILRTLRNIEIANDPNHVPTLLDKLESLRAYLYKRQVKYFEAVQAKKKSKIKTK